MELNIFMRELETALEQRGVPGETAMKHVSNLRRSFTAEDLAEIESIQSPDEVSGLADSIASILNKKRQQTPPAEPYRPRETRPVQQTAPRPQPRESYSFDEDLRSDLPARKNKQYADRDEYFEYSSESSPSTKGILIFWIGFILTLPITAAVFAALFGIFAVLFVALAALIVASVAAIVAIVSVGAVIALVGIVFGITQLFTFPAGGIYEIGLGVMIAGAVLFAAILLYNFSIRLLPWVISKLASFLGFICRKLKDLFFTIRRECYKL